MHIDVNTAASVPQALLDTPGRRNAAYDELAENLLNTRLGARVRIPLVELPGGKQGNLKRVQGNVVSACKGDRMLPSARLDNPQGRELPII